VFVTGRAGVVITGVGAVTAVAHGGRDAVVAALTERPRPDAEHIDRALATLVDGADARRLSRVSQLTVAAARLAMADAEAPAEIALALVVGTELGDLRSTIAFADGYLARGPAGLSPLLFPSTVMNTMAAATAIAVRARDLSLTINAPTVAGELAIARAAAAVAAGRVPMALAGGVDEIDPTVAAALAEARAPLLGRGEGAAFLVLETRDAATARGARILGEILGAASGALPAPPHGVGRGVSGRVIGQALDDAGMRAASLRAVYHGEAGDGPRDAWETRVLERALGTTRPRAVALGRHFGESSALGPLKAVAAAIGGPGLVHGLARGGSEVALVVGPASSR
jgi:3-oxoacyl-[acyl-carrier-protein] synthase II